MGVNGSTMSKSRRAKGYWIAKEDKNVTEIYRKFQNALALNPFTSESFLILSYEKNGHYAPHYDFLDFAPDSDNWWFVNHGNRLATALVIVKTANKGGATVFPKLNVVVAPESGDVILWFNANLKFEQEDLSFHGACPILSGRKIAMSLWIRCRHHKDIGCPADYGSSSHQLEDVIRDLGY
uniref:Fe2OG dioxygenase domain-containing protein n=1 Tax=Panagrolaimus sp. ES5 TaxID=591445 RepID=A0AC34G9F1_9BILA